MTTEPIYPATTDIDVRGVTMRLATHTRVLSLCARMNYETEVLDFIDRIPPGDVLYDLGACEGRFALYAALRGVKCYAFEPEQENFQAMLANVALNPAAAPFIFPLRLAAGAHDHPATIKIGSPWPGGHKKVLADAPGRVDLDWEFVAEQDVEVVSLDSLVASGKIPPPAYLKVDVDGSEAPFIEGAATVLASQAPRAMIIELLKRDPSYEGIHADLTRWGWKPTLEHEVMTDLYNVVYERG
jgi:FkbM family methyltransferase